MPMVFSTNHMPSQQTRDIISPDAVLILGYQWRRWANIETALGECPVFAGYDLGQSMICSYLAARLISN